MTIFVIILLMYVITILAIKSIIKDYKREQKKDRDYYKNL